MRDFSPCSTPGELIHTHTHTPTTPHAHQLRPRRNIPGGDLSTVDEWSSVLALSTKWNFDTIRDLAIARLLRLASAIDRIVLARTYAIDEWLVPAYLELTKRSAPLSLAENMRLGMEAVTLLGHVRVQARGGLGIVKLSDASIAANIAQAMQQMAAEQEQQANEAGTGDH